MEEKSLHIICLELLGATFAVQAFAKDRQNVVIQIHLDNATAVAYVNHMGGTRSPQLCAMAKSLWDWCLQRHIFIVASHIPGVINVEADYLSRTVVDRHARLAAKPSNFSETECSLGSHGDRSLRFQGHQTGGQVLQLEARPSSGGSGCLQAELGRSYRVCQSSMGTCGQMPTTCVAGRSLNSIGDSLLACTSLVPSSLPTPPGLFPDVPDLFVHHHQEYKIPLPDRASQLVAWYISGDRTRVQEFQRRLYPSSLHPGDHPLPRTIHSKKGSMNIIPKVV